MNHSYCAVFITLVFSLGQISFVESAIGGERELNQARRLFVDGKYKEIIQELEKSIQSDSLSSDGYYLLGHTYLKLDRLEDARQAFVETIQNGYWASDVFDRLAYIDKRNGRELNVMVSLELATILDPENSNYTLVLADEAVAAGRLEFAHAAYRQLVRIHPEDSGLHLKRGDLYLRLKDFQRALLAFQSAYYLGHQSELNIRNIAELYDQLGDFEEAVFWYDRLIEKQTERSSQLCLRQAQLLLQLGDMRNARHKAEGVLEDDIGEEYSSAHFLLGHIAMKEDDPDLAIRHWEKAMEDPGMHGKVSAMVGKYYSSRGQHERAIPYFQMAMRVDGTDASVLRTLVDSFIHTKNIEKAMSTLTWYLENYGLDEYAQILAKKISAVEVKDSGIFGTH